MEVSCGMKTGVSRPRSVAPLHRALNSGVHRESERAEYKIQYRCVCDSRDPRLTRLALRLFLVVTAAALARRRTHVDVTRTPTRRLSGAICSEEARARARARGLFGSRCAMCSGRVVKEEGKFSGSLQPPRCTECNHET